MRIIKIASCRSCPYMLTKLRWSHIWDLFKPVYEHWCMLSVPAMIGSLDEIPDDCGLDEV